MKNGTEKSGAKSGNLIFSLLLVGFLVAFYCYFLRPVFFNPKNEMQFFPKYVPAMKPIGNDLKMVLDFCRALVYEHTYSFKGMLTPLGYIVYMPFLHLRFEHAYRVYVGVILLAYFFLMVWLPRRFQANRSFNNIMAFFLFTGLFSYGLQMELERGQGSVLALAFCLAGVALFHARPRLSLLAFILFTIGVQIKIVPGIFILMFVRDWSDWKGNLKRFTLIGVLNFGSLLLLGWDPFWTLIKGLRNTSQNPYIWIGNHSIHGFVAEVKDWPWHYILFDPETRVTEAFSTHARLTELSLMAVFMASLGLVVLLSWRRRLRGFNPFLLVSCTLGMMLIPAESMDYRLSTLGPCLLMLFLALESRYAPRFRSFGLLRRALAAVLIILIAFAYSTTLFSYIQKWPPSTGSVYATANPAFFFDWLSSCAACPLFLMALLTAALMALVAFEPVAPPAAVEASAPVAVAVLAEPEAPAETAPHGETPNGWKIYRPKALEGLAELEERGTGDPIAPRKLRRILWSRPDLAMTRQRPRLRQSVRPHANQ